MANANPIPRRVGMVIEIKPDRIAEYKSIHSDSYPGVRDLLSEYHLKNFNIYLHQFPDGKHYLFGYYEYDGRDYDRDMAHLAAEPRNIEWHIMTDDMQIPLPGETLWATMEEVFHNR